MNGCIIGGELIKNGYSLAVKVAATVISSDTDGPDTRTGCPEDRTGALAEIAALCII